MSSDCLFISKVYITDLVSSAVTPNQELVGFQKVDIPYVFKPSSEFALFNLRSSQSW